ncbi:LiaI-LiaF-like domain-containing protein [Pedobacter sp. Hv1]|uniref:LiaF transmembrane domain-containing protein n=1 Tax=Pedobacter sp. Hv1 TaxID=1740090 RepID=UPI0006D88D59|nr:DUF5668 domain-containing protein [Pedobacter sp. Hv1]KQC00351.1 hypothetical protein AQF98_12750 [Pedobacter sp. Hv1]
MKLDRVIWGVLLLFIGGVLLLDNFNIIEFYWRNVWSFWPIFLIILGVNILFNRNNSQTGNIISLAILVIALSFLFVKGQERPSSRYWWGNGKGNHIEMNMDDEDNDGNYTKATFTEPLLAGDSAKKNILNVSGGGTSFDLKGATDSLFIANVRKRFSNFILTKESSDSVNTLTFKLQDKNKRNSWSFNDGGNDVDLRLNTAPVWEMNLKLGAGQIDFDLKDYKVRTLNFDGGAAEVDIKLGSLLPITDVNIKTGVADVKIRVPKDSGCRIKTKTGLSTKDFSGFTKIDEGLYETPNYQSSAKKIFINLDGGLSSFEVNRY